MLTDGLLLAFQKCLTFLTPGSPRTPAGTLDSPALYAGAPLSPTLPPRRVDKSRRTGAGYQSAIHCVVVSWADPLMLRIN